MKTLKEFANWLDEEVKPEFSFDVFSGLERSKALRYLVQSSLKKINSGATRSVFKLDSTRVIKIASLELGVLYNEQEFHSAKCLGSKYSVVVIQPHPEFWWLIEEYVEPIFSEQKFVETFFKHLEVNSSMYELLNSDDILGAIKAGVWGDGNDSPNREEANQNWLENSSWYGDLISRIKSCEVNPGDFYPENWGIRPSTGELVLLDLGF